MAVCRVWLVAMPSKLYTTDAYELLGLARGQEYGYSDVNKAYRRLSRKVHPDKAGGDRVRFEQLTDAFDVLKDSMGIRKRHCVMHFITIVKRTLTQVVQINMPRIALGGQTTKYTMCGK